MKRYMVSGSFDSDGNALPAFVVETPGETDEDELPIDVRENAQNKYHKGESPEAIAEYMGGKVVDE